MRVCRPGGCGLGTRGACMHLPCELARHQPLVINHTVQSTPCWPLTFSNALVPAVLHSAFLACHAACADVPAITGALLVKSVAPTNLDATSENLFSGLIPDSRYGGVCFKGGGTASMSQGFTLLFTGVLQQGEWFEGRC